MPALDMERFYRYDELSEYLHAVVAEYPGLAQLESIGKSYEGRDIWVMTMTNLASGPADEKPAYWIDANIHAGEVTGAATAMYTIQYLVTNYGQDEQVTRLLDRSAFYIAPRISPDGAERYLTTPYMLRSSVRRYPYEDERDGLYPEDINGDGLILQMRVKDPKGPWKVSSKDARLMRRREFDEDGGEYYHIYPEGLIRNWDGYTIKTAPAEFGLDLNRNFAADWAPESSQTGAGPFPMSEPETHAIAQFFTRHKNINGVQAYHTWSGVILRPYAGKSDDALPTHDLRVYKYIGDRGTELTGYPHTSVYHGFRYDPKTTLSGGFFDWIYDHLGILSFSNELWDPVSEAGITGRDFIEWSRYHPEEDDLKVLAWFDQNFGGDAFVPWTPFQHPQLGPVEIGGWKQKQYWQNAPARFLPDIAHKHMLFTLSHAMASPRLGFKLVKIEQQGGDTYHVIAIVENSGFLPTYTSARAQERKAVEPIRVTLELPAEATLVSGERSQEIGQLQGRSNKMLGGFPPPSGAGDQEKKLEWVIRAAQGSEITITAASQRAGTAHATLQVPGE